MNVIAFDAAYSLYPHATFIERRMQIMKDLTEDEYRAITKYGRRGFRIQANYFWPHTSPPSDPSLYLSAPRRVNDSHSWVLALPISPGMQTRETVQMTPTSPIMSEDPAVRNSWTLECSESGRLSGDDLVVQYWKVKSTLLRYNYVVADKRYLKQLVKWFQTQGHLEYLKLDGMEEASLEEKLAVWTW